MSRRKKSSETVDESGVARVPKRRGPRLSGSARAHSSRPPQAGTMTLARFRELTSPPESNPYAGFCRDELEALFAEDASHRERRRYPYRLAAIESRRKAALEGDIASLYTALKRCQFPFEPGPRYEAGDLRLAPELQPLEPMCEIPRWLLDEVLSLIWKGMQSDWPNPNPGQRKFHRQCTSAWQDVERAAAVLEARESGVPWKDVYKVAAEDMHGTGGAEAVSKSYKKVMENLEQDPDYYRRLHIQPPHRMKVDYTNPKQPVYICPVDEPRHFEE